MKTLAQDAVTVIGSTLPGYLLFINNATPILAFLTAVGGFIFMCYKIIAEHKRLKRENK